MSQQSQKSYIQPTEEALSLLARLKAAFSTASNSRSSVTALAVRPVGGGEIQIGEPRHHSMYSPKVGDAISGTVAGLGGVVSSWVVVGEITGGPAYISATVLQHPTRDAWIEQQDHDLVPSERRAERFTFNGDPAAL